MIKVKIKEEFLNEGEDKDEVFVVVEDRGEVVLIKPADWELESEFSIIPTETVLKSTIYQV